MYTHKKNSSRANAQQVTELHINDTKDAQQSQRLETLVMY